MAKKSGQSAQVDTPPEEPGSEIAPPVVADPPAEEAVQEPIEPADPIVEPAAADETDPEAPFGRKKDGTPAKQRGRKGAGGSGTSIAHGDSLEQRLASVTPAPARSPRAAPSPPPIAADYGELGKLAANLFFALPQSFLGEEWAPEGQEPKMVADAFTHYFKATGMSDIPPGWMLTITLSGYTAAKMQKPTVRERIGGALSWCKNLVLRR